MQEATPATAAAVPDHRRWSTFGRLLTHPLLLLLVGGIISGLAATIVTKRWQDHQRALDTRRAFVTVMTRSAMTDLAALDRFAGALAGYPSDKPAAFRRQRDVADDADKKWVIESFTIQARLRTYYPRSRVNKAWETLQGKIGDLWADEQTAYQSEDLPIPYSEYQDFKKRENPIIDQTQRAAQLVP